MAATGEKAMTVDTRALVRSPRRGRPAGGGDPRVFEHLLDAPSRRSRARRERRAHAGLSVPFRRPSTSRIRYRLDLHRHRVRVNPILGAGIGSRRRSLTISRPACSA